MIRLFASLMLALWLPAALAQATFPNRPLRLIVTTAPGGGSDTLGRLIAHKLSDDLKVPVIVENKPGAGGSIATREMLRAPADGHTLLLATSSTHGINPWFYKDLGYDVVKDFAVVSVLATTDYALAVPAASPAATVADLVALALKQKVDYGSSGNGTTTHVAAALFGKAAGIETVHVPYKAAMNSLNGLLAGEIGFMFENTSLFAPHVKAGKLRLLATTGRTRSKVAPDVPTLMQAGVAGYEIVGWFALVTHAAAPTAVVELVNRHVLAALKQEDVVQRLALLGYEPAAMSPAEGRAFVAEQLAHFGGVVQRSGAAVDR